MSKRTVNDGFHMCDAVPAPSKLWPCVCVCVCVCVSACVTSRRSVETAERIELVFGTGASFDLSETVFKEIIWAPPKIRVCPSGTMSQTLDFKNFTTTRRSSQRVVNSVLRRGRSGYRPKYLMVGLALPFRPFPFPFLPHLHLPLFPLPPLRSRPL